MCIAGLAGTLLPQGRAEEAARLLGTVEAALEGESIYLHPIDRAHYEQSVSEIRRTLGDHRAGALMQEGRASSLPEGAAQAERSCSPNT
jgi:hypothetical protein